MSGAQQQPQAGMRRIPLALESYQHVSPPLSNKTLINFYAEKAPNDARSEVVLMPVPGLTTFFTVGDGPILAMAAVDERLYVVSGTRFYRVSITSSGNVIEDLGDVGSPITTGTGELPGFVTIAAGTSAVVVCVPPRAYTCGIAPGDPLNQIGGSFTGGSSVAYLDGYFVFTSFDDLTEFFVSGINDPADYDALDFAHLDAAPNVLRRVVSYRRQLWMIGEDGIEVWYDSGDADFPLRRMPGGVLTNGCANAATVATGDNSVWWVGTQGVVYRSDAFTAKRVSNHAIEWLIRQFGARQAIRGFFWIENGHGFYALTLANATTSTTMVYDISTQVWHQRISPGGIGDWRASTVLGLTGSNYYGDMRSGAIFATALTTTTEDGTPLVRQAVLPPLWGGTRRAFCARIEIESSVGTQMASGNVSLDWSDDGGMNWSPGRTMSLGAFGAGRTRLYATRLGSFRQRMFRITTSGSPTIYALDADITLGVS